MGGVQIWVYRSAINPNEERHSRVKCSKASVKFTLRVNEARLCRMKEETLRVSILF
jgi:hypothetical protein